MNNQAKLVRLFNFGESLETLLSCLIVLRRVKMKKGSDGKDLNRSLLVENFFIFN